MAFIDNYKDIEWSSSSPIRLEYEAKITPRIYLEYAIEDLSLGKEHRTLINAISNAKRALHLQAETISNAFGIKSTYPKGIIPFPKIIGFLKDCGIVGDRILRKLNKIRNSVEHDYYLPSENEVDNFIDIVELFIAATDRLVMCFPSNAEIEYSEKLEGSPEIQDVSLDANTGKIYLFVHPGKEVAKSELDEMDIYEWKKKYSIVYSSKDPEFFGWVNWLVHAHI
ncbi:hypothetical protein [Halomonas sp. SL1]|uniref:hypothetical protein n=1 Tax=Halomonas sp. SL1 TaxID=2137478 RepID=UPI0011B93627|nr:hypothetical protein [Halomonas sp. SL1]